jgi:hypothetical protein
MERVLFFITTKEQNMLDGTKLIITPLEGGGYEVTEEVEPITMDDIVSGVGAIVVTCLAIGAICWFMDRLTQKM